jgi:flavin reductase (DIM6/NTAB) family NADH-FMN oxidoreductase RutF
MKTKTQIKEATMKTFPLPVTLVTSVDGNGNPNIITITYVTGVNEDPPMIAIAIRPEKYSNKIIKDSGEFVVNVPTLEILSKIDYCGTFSGKDVNKFKNTNLTSVKSNKVKPPLIKECPINIECKVTKIINLPSHDLFVGEVVALHGDCLNKRLDFVLTTFLDYHVIGKKIGTAFKENQKICDYGALIDR